MPTMPIDDPDIGRLITPGHRVATPLEIGA